MFDQNSTRTDADQFDHEGSYRRALGLEPQAPAKPIAKLVDVDALIAYITAPTPKIEDVELWLEERRERIELAFLLDHLPR